MNTLQGSFPAGNRLIRLDYQAGLSGLIGSIASAATARFSHMEENASGWAYVETPGQAQTLGPALRSEEHTSELQSRVDISYAVLCLTKWEVCDGTPCARCPRSGAPRPANAGTR